MRRRWRVAAVLMLILAVLNACASDVDHRHDVTGDGGDHAPYNDADVAFARTMIPHHQQAVVLAAMVPTNTPNPDLRVMATHIGSAQRAEIGVLEDLLAGWGERSDGETTRDEPVTDPHAGHHDGMRMMAGMVDEETMQRLPTLYDGVFDTLWKTSMISHHQGAVAMAQDELAHGESSAAKHLANLIIESQQREILRMKHFISATE
ncbi:DUF305 domain-containing protein [Mycolicibacterium palauense]|uniref:DUF305 domain-containing protein n=1 Tax=Mycolicibacterium palauense TaxID=2034511 RepID=UPI001FE2A8CD|nr:DUF305 domain-containing protein [Mycolicibacterium palauense]